MHFCISAFRALVPPPPDVFVHPRREAERAEAPLFRITRDGQRVAYTGRLIKRAPATEADLVRIAPGATLTYSAELTATYDLSRNGTYAIEYLGKGAGEAAPLQTKAALYVWLEGRSTRTAAPAAAIPPSAP